MNTINKEWEKRVKAALASGSLIPLPKTPKLKPCPFHGKECELVINHRSNPWVSVREYFIYASCGVIGMAPADFEGNEPAETILLAIKQWNTR